MQRTLAFIQNHKVPIFITVIGASFMWILLSVQSAIATLTSPNAISADVIETTISPINTKAFDDLAAYLESEAGRERTNWAAYRNPFTGA